MDDRLSVPSWVIPSSVALASAGGAYIAYRKSIATGVKGTAVRGPPRTSWLIGQKEAVWGQEQAPLILEQWAEQYGSVFLRPGPMGGGDLCITDPKAAAHILGNSEHTWHVNPLTKIIIENIVGSGLLSADGASHKRQRKSISPGFTTVKIREYSAIFQDCAQKLASKWEAGIDSTEDFTVDVQKWFGAYSLDTIGLSGFSHDFGALDGTVSPVAKSIEDVTNAKPGIADAFVFFLSPAIPILNSLPTNRQNCILRLRSACRDIARHIMKEAEVEEKSERSILALLVKAEAANSGSAISEDELTAQICTFLIAGYETTSSILTWILIHLTRDVALQSHVRAELFAAFPGTGDADYETLADPIQLPILNAIIHEVLRLHPPLLEAWRTAQHDDILPLHTPVTLPTGEVTDKLVIAKGTNVAIHEQLLNRSKALWGSDAWEFKPERWLTEDGIPEGAKEITGYHHLMTFLDGPKVCVGRSFAITNIKVLLSTLLRRFTFELPQGPETKFTAAVTIVHRPKLADVDGFDVKMRVARVEA